VPLIAAAGFSPRFIETKTPADRWVA